MKEVQGAAKYGTSFNCYYRFYGAFISVMYSRYICGTSPQQNRTIAVYHRPRKGVWVLKTRQRKKDSSREICEAFCFNSQKVTVTFFCSLPQMIVLLFLQPLQ